MLNFLKNKNPKDLPWKKLLLFAAGFAASVSFAGILFIKLDTAAAANFTDQVLRPVFGDARVVSAEQIFFNTSDVFDQIKYAFVKPSSPLVSVNTVPLSATTTGGGGSSSSLNLLPIVTTARTPLAGEGQWQDIPLSLFPGQIVAADTFIRPDPARSYAFVTLVKMNMSKLRLWSVAGRQEPGGKAGKPGPGIIPKSVHDAGILVAAFNGGFQYSDGQYGMIVGTSTYLPLKNDLATLVGYQDGSLKIVKYEGQNLGNNIAFVRQNCPILIENGAIQVQNEANKALWGRTRTSSIYTWRSGIGVTAKGNLIFAAGNSLLPSTLAEALKAAGAVNAMQLDINSYWVRFNIFNNYANGHYDHFSIMKGVVDGSYDYLHGYQKDFFYLTKK